MNSSGLVSGIYAVSEWVMRFSVINVLWVIFNIPILFIVASMFFLTSTSQLFILVAILSVLAPILFFPATQAMFASMRTFILKREEQGLIKMYWKFYKENYKNSFLAGVIFTLLWLIWYVDVYYFSKENILFMFIFMVLGAVLFVFTINYFSVGAHYNMNLLQLIKNAFLLTLGSAILFFAVLFSGGFILLMSIYKFQFLFFFFTGSLIAFLAFSAFYQTTIRLKKN
ncbi:YesL family protein [Oceanobacillus sp. FSL H7-0719]|uniref:YesL family protein n=1 Tax=Oceanobacillus sp. FSL H7-0719 TaxID=2954507 RepID=UPI003250AD5A